MFCPNIYITFKKRPVSCLVSLCCQIPLPDQPPWFSLFGASEQDLIEISCCILRLYTLRCESLTALQQQVEESRLMLDAQYHASKPATDTPTRDPEAGFSPASKAGGFIDSPMAPECVSVRSFSRPLSASPAENQKNHESPLSHLALKNVCRKISSRER